MDNKFTHVGADNSPQMVDVGAKPVKLRTASARAIVVLGAEIIEALQGTGFQTKKGPVFQTAILAGVMAAKKTGDLIPLCHPLGLDRCDLTIEVRNENEVVINCTAALHAKTGVEMEAMTGASVAALTIYDMCKAFSHDIIIRDIRLMEKTGGKRDFKRNEQSE